ncbi:uncharacterized protein [Physcomitrium patens]|uniref:Uncharacterized protein n=1 Tax=Physcomitrium patens TaxID=3218 RepID=A0A2K1IGI9_PHYPA|nr:uncharacterized protein LOC112276460 [Physcomitrium patens]PNR28392.1 hypothetical protein PHYPA_028984 [Physcomitrium patens]|eukprot:XP_024363584.1 uncharacterized protein LOC112276460 [Physcomitrella patens]
MASSAAPACASSLPWLSSPVPSSRLSSPELSRCGVVWRCCPIGGIVRGVRYGATWSYPSLRRRSEYGLFAVARMTNREKDVVIEKDAREQEQQEEPLLLRIGVFLVTEILRLFSNFGSSESATAIVEVEQSPVENQTVLEVLREDYERAYFLTGDFTPTLYADDCLFADPTIQFRGRDRYQRNLKLLVPFFEEPKLILFDIQEEGELQDSKSRQHKSINANWNLRTYLRLPWKPLIDVDGSTLYVLDANSKIVKHIESWSISGWQAVQQLFVPSDRAFRSS